MNSGSYTWKITNRQLINSICNAKFNETFSSDVFEIAKLKWKMIVYPNGFCDASKGSFMICVKLMEMPKTWKKLITCRTSNIVETGTSHTAIEHFTTSSLLKACSDYLLRLSELKTAAPSEITIVTSINILYITLQNNQLLYQMQIRNFKAKHAFSWKIDQSMIKQCKFVRQLESPISAEMWRMGCLPGGGRVKEYLALYLILLALPMNVAKLKISYTLKCVEVNVSKSGTKQLHFDGTAAAYSVGFSKFIPHEQVKNLDALTFEAKIDVLNGYDEKDNEISLTEIQWNSYANQRQLQQQEQKYDNVPNDEFKEIQNEMDSVKQQLRDQNNNNVQKMAMVDARLDSLSTNIEQNNKLMKQIQNNLNEITKQITDLKLISEEKKMDEIDNMKQEMEIMKRNINILMNEKLSNNNKKNKKQEALKQWMTNVVELPQYIDVLIENGIEDMDTIKHITMNELQMIGIEKIGHKIKITKAIQQLNQQNQQPNQYEGGTGYI